MDKNKIKEKDVFCIHCIHFMGIMSEIMTDKSCLIEKDNSDRKCKHFKKEIEQMKEEEL